MRIAILGAGSVGGSLGQAWATKGHDVVFGVRNVADAAAVAAVAKTGGRARVLPMGEATKDAEVVAIAVPFGAVASALESSGSLAGRIVIDCTNAVGTALPTGVASAGEFVAKLAVGAHVVKAFNSMGAENITAPTYAGVAATAFFCGDDATAKKTVSRLIADVGFDPVDVGALSKAGLLESATLLWFSASQTLGTRRIAFRLLRE